MKDTVSILVRPADKLTNILEEANYGFTHRVTTFDVMQALEAGLHQVRSEISNSEWKIILAEIRNHPVMNSLLQDPLTWHSINKPHGYPGDAGLLDLIYRQPEIPIHNKRTVLGEQIFEYTCEVKASKAVRARKELLAAEIEATLQHHPKSRILSVGCGHLRELELIRKPLGDFVAFDHDACSLQTVQSEWGYLGVRSFEGTIRDLLRNDLGRFDFIYAAGLYDYFQMPIAKKLTARLFSFLNPNGLFLIANFLPDIWESGYMEAIMDWWLVQKSLGEIASLSEDIPASDISAHEIRKDKYDRIGYLKIRRA